MPWSEYQRQPARHVRDGSHDRPSPAVSGHTLGLVARDLSIKEEIVRATVENALGVPVEQYDDGSQPGMHDLAICFGDDVRGAVEVTSDADEQALSTLGTLHKRGRNLWEPAQLRLSWALQTKADVSVKGLETDVELSLARFEDNGLRTVDDYAVEDWAEHQLRTRGEADNEVVRAWRRLRAAGVIRAIGGDAQRPAVSVHPEIGGGSWDGNADVVTDWIEAFCSAPENADNIQKLSRAGAREAHLAVFAHLRDDLWEVCSAIDDRRNAGVLPSLAPILPTPITTIWLFCTPALGGSTALTWGQDHGWSRVPIIR